MFFMQKIETRMCDLPQLWDEYDEEKYFTVGRGKARYCLWTCGNSGLHYCYQVDQDGYACKKRAVEPFQTVFLHIVR